MPPARRSAAVAVPICLALALALAPASCGRPPAPPASEPLPPGSYRAEISAPVPATAKAGAEFRVDAVVKNASPNAWRTKGDSKSDDFAVYLSYHWFRADGSQAVWDGPRTAFPPVVAAGASVPVTVRIVAPGVPGAYVLELDVVQERVTWFRERGSKSLRAEVRVE